MMCSLKSFGKLGTAATSAWRGLAACAQQRATFATGPRQADTTFYEFRTYSIKPAMMSEFTRLTNEHFHLRTAHSEMIGYWTVELGGLNKVFHIWKYDNFAQRAAVRAKLSQDKEWQEKYIAKAIPFVEKQDNEIAYLVPWSKIQKPEKAGVYEMVSFQFKPGGPAVWGDAFRAAVSTHVNTGYTKLVGVFNTEYGLLNQVHVLWWNESPDQRAAGRHLAHEDARVVAADASTFGLGAVLSQEGADGKEHRVAYIRRKLLPREVVYAAIERECLAVVWALKKLQPYLYGRRFTVVTDNNLLVWLHRVSGDNGRMLRWSLALQPFDFSVVYRPGRQNGNADGLSRQTTLEP